MVCSESMLSAISRGKWPGSRFPLAVTLPELSREMALCACSRASRLMVQRRPLNPMNRAYFKTRFSRSGNTSRCWVARKIKGRERPLPGARRSRTFGMIFELMKSISDSTSFILFRREKKSEVVTISLSSALNIVRLSCLFCPFISCSNLRFQVRWLRLVRNPGSGFSATAASGSRPLWVSCRSDEDTPTSWSSYPAKRALPLLPPADESP